MEGTTMPVLVQDPSDARRIRARRRANGSDRWDEVWDGVYILMPLPNDDHQGIQSRLVTVCDVAVGLPGLGLVRAGVNVTDREDKWKKNYRCPDVVVYMKGTAAENRGSHWLGGPDFAVEVVSRQDRSREKLDFYARVNVRELLLVDRYPWALELYRLHEGELVLVGRSTADEPTVLTSEVVPLSFRLVPGEERPAIEVLHHDGVQRWRA